MRLTIRIRRGTLQDPEIARSLILRKPGIVEEDLRILDAHLMAGRHGLIDLVGVDVRGSFLLIELDRGNEEDLLRRIREHQAWVASQALFLRKLYGTGPLNPFRPPRVLALAKRFSEKFLRDTEELKPTVTPLLYKILSEADEPALQLQPARADEDFQPLPLAPPRAAEPDASKEPVAQENLTPEEWEAFYGYERRRLGLEPDKQGVKP
jgi:hypothetical protein